MTFPKQTTDIIITHVTIPSNKSYEHVMKLFENQMKMVGDIDEFVQQLASSKAPWKQIKQTIEKRLGKSGFGIFSKVEHGRLLSLAGKPRNVCQYTVGNPLFAIKMIERVPPVALYAPIRLVVYEDNNGKTFVDYDRFSTLLSQFQNEEIMLTAKKVEEELEALLIKITS